MYALTLSTPLLLAAATDAVFGAFGAAAGVLVLLSLAQRFLYLCKPNEILIFTGRRRADGGGSLVIMGRGTAQAAHRGIASGKGRAWRIPIIERVDKMDVSTISTDIVVQNAYSAGNIPLRIHAIANVKVHSNPALVRNAIERFLGRSRMEVQVVAQQTLEGALREVLAQMTPEEVNEDRLSFAEHLMKAAADDLDKLGLQLDTLKIQSVSDETGYLDFLGRPWSRRRFATRRTPRTRPSRRPRRPRPPPTSAPRPPARSPRRRSPRAQRPVADRAELDGEARAVEEEVIMAAKTARAAAEQELQRVRRAVVSLRLSAEVTIPAEFEKAAAELRAKADAAPTIENGEATVRVLEVTAQAWDRMGPKAKELYVIQNLEDIVSTVIEKTHDIEVREVTMLDRGDGSSLASYAAAFPQTVAAILQSCRPPPASTSTRFSAATRAGRPRLERPCLHLRLQEVDEHDPPTSPSPLLLAIDPGAVGGVVSTSLVVAFLAAVLTVKRLLYVPAQRGAHLLGPTRSGRPSHGLSHRPGQRPAGPLLETVTAWTSPT